MLLIALTKQCIKFPIKIVYLYNFVGGSDSGSSAAVSASGALGGKEGKIRGFEGFLKGFEGKMMGFRGNLGDSKGNLGDFGGFECFQGFLRDFEGFLGDFGGFECFCCSLWFIERNFDPFFMFFKEFWYFPLIMKKGLN